MVGSAEFHAHIVIRYEMDAAEGEEAQIRIDENLRAAAGREPEVHFVFRLLDSEYRVKLIKRVKAGFDAGLCEQPERLADREVIPRADDQGDPGETERGSQEGPVEGVITHIHPGLEILDIAQHESGAEVEARSGVEVPGACRKSQRTVDFVSAVISGPRGCKCCRFHGCYQEKRQKDKRNIFHGRSPFL